MIKLLGFENFPIVSSFLPKSKTFLKFGILQIKKGFAQKPKTFANFRKNKQIIFPPKIQINGPEIRDSRREFLRSRP